MRSRADLLQAVHHLFGNGVYLSFVGGSGLFVNPFDWSSSATFLRVHGKTLTALQSLARDMLDKVHNTDERSQVCIIHGCGLSGAACEAAQCKTSERHGAVRCR